MTNTATAIDVFPPRRSPSGKIYAQVLALMSEVGTIGKNKKSPDLPYSFRASDDVDAHLQPLLVKHQVIIAGRIMHSEATERQNPNNPAKVTSCFQLKMEFDWITDDGSFFSTSAVGYAYDQSDKAANKAMTAARKYTICQTLCIPVDKPADIENDNIETGPRVRGITQPAPQQAPGGGYKTKEEALAAAAAKKQKKELTELPSGVKIGPAPGATEDAATPTTNAPAAPKPKETKAGSGQPAAPANDGQPAPTPSTGSNALTAPKPDDLRLDRPGKTELLQVFQAGQPKGWDMPALNKLAADYLPTVGVDMSSTARMFATWEWKHFEHMLKHVMEHAPGA